MAEVAAAVQSGRADAAVVGGQIALVNLQKTITTGVIVRPKPVIYLPTTAVVRREPDKTWRDFLDSCVSYRHPTSIVSRLCIAGSSKIDIFFG